MRVGGEWEPPTNTEERRDRWWHRRSLLGACFREQQQYRQQRQQRRLEGMIRGRAHPATDATADRWCQDPHTHITRPIIDQLIDKADRFFELGIYLHNPFARQTEAMMATNGNRTRDCNGSTGADKVAVLIVCGDAAHAMPPFLGQGTNRAIQDAYCLANAIQQPTMQHDEQANGGDRLEDILKTEYKGKRWPTTTGIMDIMDITATTGIMAKVGLLVYLEAS